MITQQDLELLERLYTPLAKILLEHLRIDHGYTPGKKDSLLDINKQQADRIRDLTDLVDELTIELKSLKSDYEALHEIHNMLLDPGKGMV